MISCNNSYHESVLGSFWGVKNPEHILGDEGGEPFGEPGLAPADWRDQVSQPVMHDLVVAKEAQEKAESI